MSATTSHRILATGIEIRYRQESEVIDSWMGVKKPDKDWKEIDQEGHIHAWIDDQLPTLDHVQIGTQWIGDECDSSEVPVYQHQCKVCGQVIVPEYVVDRTPQYVRGPGYYSLFISDWPGEREWRIPDEDVGPLIEILQRIFTQ